MERIKNKQSHGEIQGISPFDFAQGQNANS